MTRTDAYPGFGSLFSTLASVASPGFGRAGPQLRARPVQPRGLRRGLDLLLAWSERTRQRRELLRLDDRLLRDIGITRAEATAEAEKPFWRA